MLPGMFLDVFRPIDGHDVFADQGMFFGCSAEPLQYVKGSLCRLAGSAVEDSCSADIDSGGRIGAPAGREWLLIFRVA